MNNQDYLDCNDISYESFIQIGNELYNESLKNSINERLDLLKNNKKRLIEEIFILKNMLNNFNKYNLLNSSDNSNNFLNFYFNKNYKFENKKRNIQEKINEFEKEIIKIEYEDFNLSKKYNIILNSCNNYIDNDIDNYIKNDNIIMNNNNNNNDNLNFNSIYNYENFFQSPIIPKMILSKSHSKDIHTTSCLQKIKELD